jgi:hypothetical protein
VLALWWLPTLLLLLLLLLRRLRHGSVLCMLSLDAWQSCTLWKGPFLACGCSRTN